MIATCCACGNHEWNKIVLSDEIVCPVCGEHWKMKKQPVFFLTGCSGVGKTTTGIELQRMTEEYVVLDSDLFYNIMKPQSDDDYYAMLEQILRLTLNIQQAGKTVVWTMAGSIDKLAHTYGSRFFSEIKVLALTCDEEILRKRMREGRGIADPEWIRSSVEYNHYFKTHSLIGDTKFENLDCSRYTPHEVALKVYEWLRKNDRSLLTEKTTV